MRASLRTRHHRTWAHLLICRHAPHWAAVWMGGHALIGREAVVSGSADGTQMQQAEPRAGGQWPCGRVAPACLATPATATATATATPPPAATTLLLPLLLPPPRLWTQGPRGCIWCRGHTRPAGQPRPGPNASPAHPSGGCSAGCRSRVEGARAGAVAAAGECTGRTCDGHTGSFMYTPRRTC